MEMKAFGFCLKILFEVNDVVLGGLMSDKPLFNPDELELVEVDEQWSKEMLLGRDGIFFLKDILTILELDAVKVKRHARDLLKRGENPWQVMGVKKVWNHWIVRMTVFAPYFREHLASVVRNIPKSWDGNRMLAEKGVFRLSEVCRLIPFTSHQIRYQAKQRPDAEKEMGVWKEPALNAYLVDMERFSHWLAKVWLHDF